MLSSLNFLLSFLPSQLTLWTLDSFLAQGLFVPAQRFFQGKSKLNNSHYQDCNCCTERLADVLGQLELKLCLLFCSEMLMLLPHGSLVIQAIFFLLLNRLNRNPFDFIFCFLIQWWKGLFLDLNSEKSHYQILIIPTLLSFSLFS